MKRIGTLLIGLILVVALVAAGCGGSKKLSISSSEDIKDKKISAQRGTVGYYAALDLVGEANEKNVEGFEKYVDAITSLKQGKVQATIMDEGPAKAILAKNDDLLILPEIIQQEDYAIAVKKGNAELLAQINEVLGELTASGELKQIIDKYINDEPGIGKDIDFNVGAAGGVIKMGTESGFPPYEMKTSDGYIGIDVEIASKIAKALDKELKIEDMPFDSLVMALDTDAVDFVAAGMSVTEDRKKSVDFTTPYFKDAKQVVVIQKANYAGK